MLENVDVVVKKSVNQLNLPKGTERFRVNIRNMNNNEACDIVYESSWENGDDKCNILLDLLGCRAAYLSSDSPADFLGNNLLQGDGMMNGIKRYTFCEEITDHLNRMFTPEEILELEDELRDNLFEELEGLDDLENIF